MKKFTKSALLIGAAFCSLTAAAQVGEIWQEAGGNETFLPIHRSGVATADFNSDGKMDVYVLGNGYCNYYQKPGLWNWQTTASLYYNNGDWTWTRDIIEIEPTGEFTAEVPDNPETEENEYVAPQEMYRFVPSRHGMCPMESPHMATFDYNNDGLVDIVQMGKMSTNDVMKYYETINTTQNSSGTIYGTALYKNNGDGTFAYVAEAALPALLLDKDNQLCTFYTAISAGDYDRDGFTDLLLNGRIVGAGEGEAERGVFLYRNINGTGHFENMLIAEVIGGAWTNETQEANPDDPENPTIIPGQPLPEGTFLPTSGNVYFVDFDNDGWLDIISHGWANNCQDTRHYKSGSITRLYKNMNGEKFKDITGGSEFYCARGAELGFCDLDGDGYLDMLNSGWGDNGIGWASYAFYNNGEGAELPYESSTDMSAAGLDVVETFHYYIRDFDADGNFDVWYDGQTDGAIYFGNGMESFEKSTFFPHIRSYGGMNGNGNIVDVDGNGIADRFTTGYNWIDDGVYNGTLVDGAGWCNASILWKNTTEGSIEAPEAPATVEATIDDNNNLTVTWTDVDDINCAYNIVVKADNGKVIANLPVDPETGFLRVTAGKHSLVRPGVQSYTFNNLPAGPSYTAGVQAVAMYSETASAITYAPAVDSGVESVVADENAPIEFFNLQGVRVEKAENGIFIRRQGSTTTTVVR